MNFCIIVVSWELAAIPNKVSSVVGEIWHAFTWLNQFKTFWVNNLVNIYSIKECWIESLFLQYKHSLSALKPNLKSSFLVTIFLWINLNWNSFNLVSPQMFFSFGWMNGNEKGNTVRHHILKPKTVGQNYLNKWNH